MADLTLPQTGEDDDVWGPILNTALTTLNDAKLEKGELVLNADDYGAVGDGVTDDTTAIQAAISSLPAAGGVVFLPQPVYATTAPLVLAGDSIVLRGTGTTATTIRYTGSGTAVTSSNAAIRRYCGLEHLMVQCITAGATALTLDNAYRWRCVKVRFESQNGTTGIAVNIIGSGAKSTYFNEFHSCDFHGSYASVKLNDNVNGSRFFAGVMEGNGFSVLMPGTGANSGTNTFMGVGMQSTGANSAGVIVQVGTLNLSGGTSQSSYNSFIGCRIETSTTTTIRFETNGWYNSIIGGSIAGTTTIVDLAAGGNLILVSTVSGATFKFPLGIYADTLNILPAPQSMQVTSGGIKAVGTNAAQNIYVQSKGTGGSVIFNGVAGDGTGGIQLWSGGATPALVAYLDGAGKLVTNSNVEVAVVGKGVRVKEGSGGKQGVAALVAGTVTVASASVTAVSRILLTSQVDGGTPGFLRVSGRTAATSFTITSSSASDTSTVAFFITEPA